MTADPAGELAGCVTGVLLFANLQGKRELIGGDQDKADAERVAGFRPLLPPAAVVSGAPKLTVIKHQSISYTVNVADLERGLAAAGITDVRVPGDWNGVTMRVGLRAGEDRERQCGRP